MKKISVLLVFGIFFCSISKSQDPFFTQWTAETVDEANTAVRVNYLTSIEKEIIYRLIYLINTICDQFKFMCITIRLKRLSKIVFLKIDLFKR